MSNHQSDKDPNPTETDASKGGGGGTAWRLTMAMLEGFQKKDSNYAAVLTKKDEDMAEANRAALESKDKTIRMLWVSLMLCIILLGVVAGAIGTGTLKIAGLGEIGLGEAEVPGDVLDSDDGGVFDDEEDTPSN